jgi:hypothetical protein
VHPSGRGSRLSPGDGHSGCRAGADAPGRKTGSHLRPTVARRGAPDRSAHCAPKLGDFNRTAACAGDAANVDVYDDENGDLAGSFSFEMYQGIHLQVKKTDFIEYDEVTQFVPLAGTVPAISMEFDASCVKPCHATTHFPQSALLAVGVKGTVSYTDAVGKGHVDETHPNYVLNLTSAGYTLVSSDGPPFIYPFPIDFRCDDTLPGQGAGCVFPRYTPTIRTMTTLPDIAKNIAKAQRGPGKYGKPGSKHPLHRLVNKAQQKKNHDEVCGKKVRGPAPKGKSCDEYPFQSTEEGGTKLSKENRSWAWVPTHQQDSQGGILRKFYYENRVLNKDAFWVKV